jgi:hypothetical protein
MHGHDVFPLTPTKYTITHTHTYIYILLTFLVEMLFSMGMLHGVDKERLDQVGAQG